MITLETAGGKSILVKRNGEIIGFLEPYSDGYLLSVTSKMVYLNENELTEITKTIKKLNAQNTGPVKIEYNGEYYLVKSVRKGKPDFFDGTIDYNREKERYCFDSLHCPMDLNEESMDQILEKLKELNAKN